MAHQKATDEQSRKLQAATKHLFDERFQRNRDNMKKLLAPDLAQTYSLCYWGDDGCYYCSDDGRNWYVVRCIG